jgi:hypothetical protein
MTTREEYEQLLKDLEWLKSFHPDKITLISFLEKFQKFVVAEHVKNPS